MGDGEKRRKTDDEATELRVWCVSREREDKGKLTVRRG